MVAIIDYGMGNVFSVENALRVLHAEVAITRDHDVIARADHLILPGVGAFGDGMRNLRQRGLIEPLTDVVIRQRKPFLGICLGMQFLADTSDEYGTHAGLGWIAGRVIRLERDEQQVRIPHIGWNDVSPSGGSPLFGAIARPVFYFVHSYHFVPGDPRAVAATCDYGGPFVAAVAWGNIHGVQFHPEKSQQSGLQLLRNFLSLKHQAPSTKFQTDPKGRPERP